MNNVAKKLKSDWQSPLHLVPHHRIPQVAVVIPVYNEERCIVDVLEEIQLLQRSRPRWQILPIVVNDGSTDATERMLDRIAPQLGAKVISLPVNLGIGKAVQTGFQFAVRWGADVTLQLDGDGQHPADQIPRIVGPILAGKYDVAIGSRYLEGGGGNVSTQARQMGTWFFSVMLRFLTGAKIKDTTSGFRAFNYDAADFIARFYPDDYPEVEVLVPLAKRHFKLVEVPVSMRQRLGGISSISGFGAIYYLIKVLFCSVMDLIRPLPPRRHISLHGGMHGR